MKVLYVVGSCLKKNTSANMSHNGYVQGLLDNGCDVDILMAEDSWGAYDRAMPVWENAQYYSYPSAALRDKLRKKFRGTSMQADSDQASGSTGGGSSVQSLKNKCRRFLKACFYTVFPTDPLYPLEKTWLRKAAKFSSHICYDLVISNSSPAASHKLVGTLLKKNRIKCKRWVQIWEDPWFYDLYGEYSEGILEEEHSLLKEASEIYYVSPLTLKYQQEYFQDCAYKMRHIPLPYLNFANNEQASIDEWSFGYFGDYYSRTRNLLPFYDALRATNNIGYIYGDSDLDLCSTDRITVNGRVTLDVLDKVQSKTRVLVHLCNLCGGQIPGKIYHYSATDKPILFILDGTEEEQKILFEYFSQFNRFCFCKNNTEAIVDAMKKICKGDVSYEPLPDFSPKNVVKKLLDY